jgi:hypothetical protein
VTLSVDRLFARAKTACPALELTEFVRDFLPSPSMLVNTLAGTAQKQKTTACGSSTFTYKLADYFAEYFPTEAGLCNVRMLNPLDA